jgi:natural product precursor
MTALGGAALALTKITSATTADARGTVGSLIETEEKMAQQLTRKRLQLKKETVRELEKQQLRKVMGADDDCSWCTCSCPCSHEICENQE